MTIPSRHLESQPRVDPDLRPELLGTEVRSHRNGESDPEVIFIMGSGRSGSTLLGRVLGQLPGVEYVGETDLLWGVHTDTREPPWGLPIGRRCGCGAVMVDCRLWSAALPATAAELGLEKENSLAPTMLSLASRADFSKLGVPTLRRVRSRTEGLSYTVAMAVLYRNIASVMGAKAIVDSSKRRSTANLVVDLEEQLQSTVRVVHLVRQPAATAHSWNAHRYIDAKGVPQMARLGVINASLRWNVANVRAELIARRIGSMKTPQIRYEDLVNRPEYSFAALAGRLLLPGAFTPIHDNVASLNPCHTVGGHPTRIEVGDIVIEDRGDFRDQLSHARSAISSVITMPIARRYGYRASGVVHEPKSALPTSVRRSSSSGTSLKVTLVGGIYGLPDDVRSRRSMTPETVLEHGLRERGVTVTTAAHGWGASHGDADVIHVHHLGKGAVSQLFPGKKPPLVFTRHDVSTLRTSRRLALKAVFRRSSAVVALSPAEKTLMYKELPADRVHLIPNGIPSELWPFQPRTPPALGAAWRLLYAGQLIDVKNVASLIQAVASVSMRHSIVLRLAYHNSTRERQLRELAHDLEIADKVVFLGPCDTSQLRAEYAQAHLFVLPSANDAFPSVITEAMMSGVPVVATAVGGVPDQLAGHGTLASPGDEHALAAAITKALTSYGDVVHLAKLGEAFARRHYSVASMLDAHMELYHGLLRSRGLLARLG